MHLLLFALTLAAASTHCFVVQALVQQCHAEGINLAAANLAPGVHINMATLSADQAAGLLALVPTSPSLAVSTQALALTTAQACAHEAAYYCTVRLLALIHWS